jgi:ankyrin repeat domain-containing protein 50
MPGLIANSQESAWSGRALSPEAQERLDHSLLEAVGAGLFETARGLIRRGASGFFADENGDTALHEATRQDDAELIRLLAPISDPKAKNKHGKTPLMLAAGRGSLECLETLLPLSDPREADLMGSTALMSAAQASALACAQALLPLSDPLARDADGRTLLMRAVRTLHSGSQAIITVRFVLAMSTSDALARDNNGKTALMHAAACNCDADVMAALAPGSDIDAADNSGHTAIDHAKLSGRRQDVVELLEAWAVAQRDAKAIEEGIGEGSPGARQEPGQSGGPPSAAAKRRPLSL